MKFETRMEVLQISHIVAPPYNPREDIERGDARRSPYRGRASAQEASKPGELELARRLYEKVKRSGGQVD